MVYVNLTYVRCILMTGYWRTWTYTYHGLLGDVHQVLQVVILMLLKGWKQHVQHLLLISSSSLSIFLLLPFIFNLYGKSKGNKRNPFNVFSLKHKHSFYSHSTTIRFEVGLCRLVQNQGFLLLPEILNLQGSGTIIILVY